MTRWLGAAWLAACGDPANAEAPSDAVLRGGTVVGVGKTDVALRNGKIAEMGPGVGAGLPIVDITGQFLVPAFIDSHVHFAYLDQVVEMANGGIAAAVDLAAPLEAIGRPTPPIRTLWSGPMVTAVGGYPLSTWGSDGYGWPCTTAADAQAAVNLMRASGAGVIKFPVTAAPQLDDAALSAIATAAHGYGLKVAAHALGDADAARAAAAGADLLAHTPVEALTDTTVSAWSGKIVISTLRAFGGQPDTVENLRRLRAAGATVLYGTDFGNTRSPGIDPTEIALLRSAGLDGRAILDAATVVPAATWGWTDLGAITPGKTASLLVLSRDPLLDPSVLATPGQVWLAGVRRK